MEKSEPEFSVIVDEAIKKLKEIPGGLLELKSKLNKSSPVLYDWRNGKRDPSEEDKLQFLEVVNEILKKTLQKQEALRAKRVQMVVEFNKLCV